MSACKKILAIVIALGVFAPASAFAQTASTTTSTTSPAAVIGQIQALQTQINSLQLQQQQNIAMLVTTLRRGSTGDQVLILQALLAADSVIYPEGLISGFFGPLTAKAVKRFQKKHGFEQVGLVGPKTLKKLQELLQKNPLAFSTLTSTSTATSTSSQLSRGDTKRLCAVISSLTKDLLPEGWNKKGKGDNKQIIAGCDKRSEKHDEDDEDDDHRGTPTPTPTSSPTPTPTTSPTPTPTPTPVPTDITPPVNSSVSVTNIATTTATISWVTDEAATSKIYYSTATPVNLLSALTVSNSSLVTSHILGLTGLTASTTYHYILESKDAIGNTTTTTPSTQIFTTAN